MSQVPWLHMLYGACGAIVFTLVSTKHYLMLLIHFPTLFNIWCILIYLCFYSFWLITLSCSLEIEHTPSVLRNMCLELFPSMLTSFRSLSFSFPSQEVQSKHLRVFFYWKFSFLICSFIISVKWCSDPVIRMCCVVFMFKLIVNLLICLIFKMHFIFFSPLANLHLRWGN